MSTGKTDETKTASKTLQRNKNKSQKEAIQRFLKFFKIAQNSNIPGTETRLSRNYWLLEKISNSGPIIHFVLFKTEYLKYFSPFAQVNSVTPENFLCYLKDERLNPWRTSPIAK